MFNRSLISLAVAFFATHGPVAAQTERDLDSHEHGAASINVVIDATAVFVELESPWNNLVGFEHAPSTDSQREAVHQDAEEVLGTDESAIEQSETGEGHEQDQRRGGQEPGGPCPVEGVCILSVCGREA